MDSIHCSTQKLTYPLGRPELKETVKRWRFRKFDFFPPRGRVLGEKEKNKIILQGSPSTSRHNSALLLLSRTR